MFSVRQAFEWLSAGRLIGDGAVPIADVCTDTRAIRKGCLFVALRGERYDAHDFIPQPRAISPKAIRVSATSRAVSSCRCWR